MVFPLLFLLALGGWQAGLRRAAFRLPGLASALLFGLAFAIIGTFLPSTARLMGRAPGAGAAAELRRLAQAIPEDALILVPDASAALHLQVALEYAQGRDVLLVPLAGGAGADVEDAVRRFLARQIAGGRRVCLLLPRPTDLPGSLLRDFDLELLFETTLFFESVRFVTADTFPKPPFGLALHSRVLDVRLPRTHPETTVRSGASEAQ
jgi:hypothetical protein